MPSSILPSALLLAAAVTAAALIAAAGACLETTRRPRLRAVDPATVATLHRLEDRLHHRRR